MKKRISLIVILGIAALACAKKTNGATERTLFIAGYSVPSEVVQQKIAPKFAAKWAAEHNGEVIKFKYAWGSSGTITRNILSGLDADVAYLSEPSDMSRLIQAGLVAETGIVSQSLVVLRTRPGNPLRIRDWPDLLRSGGEILTPSPKTSGLGKWNVLAVAGWAKRNNLSVEETLKTLYGNVTNFAESARASSQEFEQGVGDVIITYENEALYLRTTGREIEYVIPSSTILIGNPAAAVSKYADRHGVSDVARSFVEYLQSPAAQKHLADYGFRPIEAELPPGIFDADQLGGWESIQKDFFGDGGIWDRVVASRNP